MTTHKRSDRAGTAVLGPVAAARPGPGPRNPARDRAGTQAPAVASTAAAGVREAEVLALWEAGESVADIAVALDADRYEVLNLVRAWMGRQPVRAPSPSRPPASRPRQPSPQPPPPEPTPYARQTSPRSLSLTPKGLAAAGAVDSAGLDLVLVPLLTKAGAREIAAQHGWTP